MIRQSQAIVVLVCAALVTACGSDRALGPDATSGVFASWRIAGEYDLIAEVTSFDPAWGDLTGYQYAAALAFSPGFEVSGGRSGEVGTFIVDSDEGARSGPITLSVHVGSGLFVLHLGSFAAVATYVAEPDENGVAPVIEGRFGAGGHIGGTFVATLRQ